MYLDCPDAGQRENIPRPAWCFRTRCRPCGGSRSARGTRQIHVRYMPSREDGQDGQPGSVVPARTTAAGSAARGGGGWHAGRSRRRRQGTLHTEWRRPPGLGRLGLGQVRGRAARQGPWRRGIVTGAPRVATPVGGAGSLPGLAAAGSAGSAGLRGGQARVHQLLVSRRPFRSAIRLPAFWLPTDTGIPPRGRMRWTWRE